MFLITSFFTIPFPLSWSTACLTAASTLGYEICTIYRREILGLQYTLFPFSAFTVLDVDGFWSTPTAMVGFVIQFIVTYAVKFF